VAAEIDENCGDCRAPDADDQAADGKADINLAHEISPFSHDDLAEKTAQ